MSVRLGKIVECSATSGCLIPTKLLLRFAVDEHDADGVFLAIILHFRQEVTSIGPNLFLEAYQMKDMRQKLKRNMVASKIYKTKVC